MSSPEREAALTWAGALALSHGSRDLADLQAEWSSPEALAHRALLKADNGAGPEMLRQLVGHMTARINFLKGQAA